MLLKLTPLLLVADLPQSLAFYQRLGFTLEQEWSPEGKIAWCRLARDQAAVMLQQACDEDGPAAGRGRGSVLYFLCEDAQVLHAEPTQSGLPLPPPERAFYGMLQLYLRDPDGYELCFQSESPASP